MQVFFIKNINIFLFYASIFYKKHQHFPVF